MRFQAGGWVGLLLFTTSSNCVRCGTHRGSSQPDIRFVCCAELLSCTPTPPARQAGGWVGVLLFTTNNNCVRCRTHRGISQPNIRTLICANYASNNAYSMLRFKHAASIVQYVHTQVGMHSINQILKLSVCMMFPLEFHKDNEWMHDYRTWMNPEKRKEYE